MTAAQIMPFDLGGQQMRFGMTDDGRPWVAAPDFAKGLGYAQAKDALRLVDEDEKGRQIVPTPGGPQEITVLYENGIWELIFLSRRKEAKDLKGRVKAILREIRETGRYEVAVLGDELAEIEAANARSARAVAIARAERARADKAEAFKTAIEGGDGLTLRAFHKKYFSELTERVFMEHLYKRDYLIDQRGKGEQRDDGTFRNGSQHRQPTAKGKPYFYLHGHGQIGGKRREGTRIRPGQPELDLKAALIKDGLVANNNDTGQPRAIEPRTEQPRLDEAG